MRAIKKRIVILSSVVLPSLGGCDTKESSLGDLPQSETATTTSAETGAPTASSGGGSGFGVGAACELGSVPDTRLLELDNPQCTSGMCLFADEVAASREACTVDANCNGDPDKVACSPQTSDCVLDPAYVAERSMCTDFCEVDADCVGISGTTCVGGFSCAPVTAIGSVCCEKLCVCNDDLGFYMDLQAACEQGTAPGCCDQNPPPPACGG